MSSAIDVAPAQCRVSRSAADQLRVQLSGTWKIQQQLPAASQVLEELDSGVRRITIDGAEILTWDSGLLTFLSRILKESRRLEIDCDRTGLPEGVRRLLELAFAVPEIKTGRGGAAPPWLARLGSATLELVDSAWEIFAFIGEACMSFARLLMGRARFRKSDLVLTIQECGFQALPIVSLISFLVGLILAFVGAVQLQLFAAEIFVANLVGLAMTREMGAIMTGIVMAGRTGAAFAAQLGTMTVNEEIDAFRTMAISPMDFLVMPRMLALMLMMPLLCVYADLMGILGGSVVGIGMLGITPAQYYQQSLSAIHLNDLLVGIIKSAVFGVLVALSGCLRGMQCGRSSSAVGLAATSAVVTAIVLIIVTDAMFTVICNILGV
ncbi:MAG: ABC transporter permease [Planctomycetota bacterium]